MTHQPLLFEIEAPARRKAGRSGAVVAPVGAAATTASPKPKRKRRPKPQVDGNVQPTVECGDNWWRITFPAPDRMVSVNGNPHWRTTSPIRKTWREAMHTYAAFAKLPKGLARVRISVELRFPTAGRRDAANYHGNVVKPLVDACGPAIRTTRAGKPLTGLGYGLIADDTAEYLDGPYVRVGTTVRDKAMPFGQVVVTITDLSNTATGKES